MSPRRAKTRPPVPLVPLRLPVAPKTTHNAAEAVAVVAEDAAEVAEQGGHDPKRGQELELEVKVSV